MDDIPQQNTGFIPGSGTKDLWLAGTIPYEVVLQSGDWRPYLPVGEKQKNPTETMSCVTQSNLSDLEIQEKQQTGHEPNWSDRFIAKLSGTTHSGNKLDVVANTVRNIGLVKESVWPAPQGLTWDQYYSSIPQSVIDQAEYREILFESITPVETELLYHLKQCPIQVVIPEPNPNHAVVLVHIENGLAYYFDSYSPFLKTIAINKLHAALKIVLKGTMSNAIFVHKANTTEYGFYLPASSEEAIKDKALNLGLAIEKPDHTVDFTQAIDIQGL